MRNLRQESIEWTGGEAHTILAEANGHQLGVQQLGNRDFAWRIEHLSGIEVSGSSKSLNGAKIKCVEELNRVRRELHKRSPKPTDPVHEDQISWAI
jgi:hypothetical protein